MIQMMQNMFQQSNTHQQQIPATTLLPSPTVTHLYGEQPVTIPTSASQSENDADALAASMHRTKLDTAKSAKKQKTTDPMNLENDHSPLPPPSRGQH